MPSANYCQYKGTDRATTISTQCPAPPSPVQCVHKAKITMAVLKPEPHLVPNTNPPCFPFPWLLSSRMPVSFSFHLWPECTLLSQPLHVGLLGPVANKIPTPQYVKNILLFSPWAESCILPVTGGICHFKKIC